MSTAPAGPDFPPLTEPEAATFRRLGRLLRAGGAALLVVAAGQFVLAFTGYDTPKAINVGLFLGGVVVLMVGTGMVAAGRAVGRSVAGGGDKTQLVAAVLQLNNLALIALVVFGLAAVGMVVRVATFLYHVARGEYGWVEPS